MLETSAAGIAACEDARKLIVPGSPAYLNFYVASCLAKVAERPGVRGGARCPHFRDQIAIWQASPPPIDPNEEDEAIVRARHLRNAKEEVARYCTPGAMMPPPYNPEAMLIPPTPGGTIETQEGLAYALPAGFGVRSFDPDNGAAGLRNPQTDWAMSVTRTALNDSFTSSRDYPNRETMASGAVLDWEYRDIIPGAGSYVVFGRVTLPTAYVALGIATGAKSATKSVDQPTGLEAFRTIAGSVRVVSPRRCIGECGPGELKPN